jgi:hypothetical protein
VGGDASVCGILRLAAIAGKRHRRETALPSLLYIWQQTLLSGKLPVPSHYQTQTNHRSGKQDTGCITMRKICRFYDAVANGGYGGKIPKHFFSYLCNLDFYTNKLWNWLQNTIPQK